MRFPSFMMRTTHRCRCLVSEGKRQLSTVTVLCSELTASGDEESDLKKAWRGLCNPIRFSSRRLGAHVESTLLVCFPSRCLGSPSKGTAETLLICGAPRTRSRRSEKREALFALFLCLTERVYAQPFQRPRV